MIERANHDLPVGVTGGSDLFDQLVILQSEFFTAAQIVSSLRRWNGTEWISVDLKRWDGTTWQSVQLKRWDGSGWVSV